MGSTNYTPNYNLPQFLGTDKPSWLTDINGAFSDIDTGIKNAADDAASAVSTAGSASSAAAGAVNSVNTLNNQINTPDTGIAAQVTSHTTSITNISNFIGSTPLTTTAQTLTGAVEEIKGSIPNTTGVLKFLGRATISGTFDGIKTIAEVCNEVYASLVNAFAALGANQYIKVINFMPVTGETALAPRDGSPLVHAVSGAYVFGTASLGAQTNLVTYILSSSSSFKKASDTFTATDLSSNTPTSGRTCDLVIERYEVL